MILSNCIQIEECPLDEDLRVPLLVRTCCGVVEERGLEVVGVYRVPGNSAAVNQLTEQVNRGEFRSVSRLSLSLRQVFPNNDLRGIAILLHDTTSNLRAEMICSGWRRRLAGRT